MIGFPILERPHPSTIITGISYFQCPFSFFIRKTTLGRQIFDETVIVYRPFNGRAAPYQFIVIDHQS